MAAGEIPSRKQYEDDRFFAFHDISPQAPVHVLVVPKEHVATLDDLGPQHRETMADLLMLLPKLARELGLSEDGYRVVVNCREKAGQSVFHIHFHLLGGRPMRWPPG
ncbi:MAG: histidine triad nucleotide-binding protein [Candidatus Eisenbacteria bacterium]